MGDEKTGWVSIEGPFTAKEIRDLQSHDTIERLSLTKQPLVTAAMAKGFANLRSVRWLWLWCSITRTAMRHVISIPDLETLDVLDIRHPGRLMDFASAKTLKVFRANCYMSEEDLLEVSALPALEELGAQNASLTLRGLEAILQIPNLKDLDLEATEFDDDMASTIATKTSLNKLDVGATKITRKGLKHICGMTQLRSLDIWATDINEADLEILSDLPDLEYLSIGGHDEQTRLTSNGVIPKLEMLPSLKRIWLDGIALSEMDKRHLEQRYDYVRN